jgi:hypothetical protein
VLLGMRVAVAGRCACLLPRGESNRRRAGSGSRHWAWNQLTVSGYACNNCADCSR